MERKSWSLILALAWLALSCQPAEQVVPENALLWYEPEGFPPLLYQVAGNPWSEAGFELGRRLFYDPIFSIDSTIACGDCHQPFSAFADPAHDLSIGVEGRIGIRNAPMIANVGYLEQFFWDGGVGHLDFVPVNAIENPLEMDEKMDQVLSKLNARADYQAAFLEVFGTQEIDSQLVLYAFSQFMLRLVSDQAPYDVARRGGTPLQEDEQAGQALFEQHCATCHAGNLFTDQQFRNNGLDSIFVDDLGRMTITELAQDAGLFRVPSLRNVELTAPYMHDGRMGDLEAVLEHYSNGILASTTLDPLLPVGGLDLSTTEQLQIIQFLKTLTDREFVTNPRFFDPN